MLMQEVITIPVIDTGFRMAHCGQMLTHDEIRDALIAQIDAGTVKQASVAKHLCVAPARIAEVRSGKRRIQPDEMARLANYLGLTSESSGNPVESVSLIPILGRVAQGVWMEQTDIDPSEQEYAVYDKITGGAPPKDLFAVIPEGTSMNLRFPPGTHLICRRVPFGSGEYQSGSYVIVERTAHELTEMTVKRLEMDAGGSHWLHSESSDKKYQEPWQIGSPDEGHHDDREVRVVAQVVRAIQDLTTPLSAK